MRKILLYHSHMILVLLIFSRSLCFADDLFSFSGRLNLRGVEELNDDSMEEDPSLKGRLEIDTSSSKWRFYSWLEGGWDGSVKRSTRDHTLFKRFDRVYQSNTPYLEFKELYAAWSVNDLELRAGIQRFAWGRLDEYPVNDLINPWDYTQFLRKPLEDRKIGVPSLSASLIRGDWGYDLVWVPILVPYRLSRPDERWSGVSSFFSLIQMPDMEIMPSEPDLPSRTITNSEVGLRVRHLGDIEWAFNLFHGYDPRPVFKTTALIITPKTDGYLIDPGYMPDFHKMTSIGMDAAAVKGDWSLRAEAAYAFNRWFDIREELWGYLLTPAVGVYPLESNQRKSDTLDYGIGVDYRIIEDVLLTMQAQQTAIIDRSDTLYYRNFETLLWMNLKIFCLNQKVETNFNAVFNPEHGDTMEKANLWYVITDSWKAGITAILFNGPAQSIFGRFSINDQIEAELVYAW